MPAPSLGDGVYTIPEAARVLRLVHQTATPSVRQVRSWLSDGLTFGTRATDVGVDVVSFLDLVSLETVSRLADYFSVQRIKRLEAEIRHDFPDLEKPFASQTFYIAGETVWLKWAGVEVEVGGRHRGQVPLSAILRSFATEIRFNHHGVAEAWTPNEFMELDPHIQFGQPVLRGTRIAVSTVAANLGVGTPKEVAHWYGIPVETVEGLARYLSLC